MTMFKITRKKVTFGGLEQLKKNIRESKERMKKKISEISSSPFSFGLTKDPRAEIVALWQSTGTTRETICATWL